jgi:DNA-binding transcriptional ArsR family regulator
LGTKREVMVDVQRLSLAGVMLDQARWQAWLRGLIEGGQLDLVVLDPISEMYGGKELRDDPPFRSLLGFLKRLKLDFPQLVTLLVHHTKKPGGNERSAPKSIEDVRGQWGQTPDVVIVMWPLGDRRLRWEVHKRVPHSALILEQNPGGLLINVADETTGATQRESTDNRVLTAIDAGATTADEIALGTGLSRRGVYKALSRLSEAELISKRQPFERIETAEDHEWTTPSDEELAR